MRRPGRTLAALVIAIALGLAVRVVVCRPVSYGSDSYHYLLLARSLAAGNGFHSGGSQHPDLSRSPLFPMLIAGFSWLTGTVESAAALVIMLASSLVVVPLFWLARDGFDARTGLAALALGALSCLVATAERVTPAPLFVLLGLSSAAATWWAVRHRRAFGFVLAGVCVGASALTRFEGLAFFPAFGAWIAVDAPGRRAWRMRIAPVLLFLAAGLALYVPYAVWVSNRLGRISIAPGIRYLQDARFVSDRFGLRDVEGPELSWTERARFLATADHTGLVLETYFNSDDLPEPDLAYAAPSLATVQPDRPPDWTGIARRRAHILLGDLAALPRTLVWAHFVPAVPLLLGLLGTGVVVRKRGTRRVFVFLLLATSASLAPLLSHIETRFLFLPFAFGLVVSAAGWGYLAARMSGWQTVTGRVVRVLVHVGLIVSVAAAGLKHAELERERWPPTVDKEFGITAGEVLPPGPLLSVHPDLPYWAGRPYRAIPVGSPEVVLDFARAQHAAGMIFDNGRDLLRRPHLASLFRNPLPPGYHLVLARGLPGGHELRLFELEPRLGLAER